MSGYFSTEPGGVEVDDVELNGEDAFIVLLPAGFTATNFGNPPLLVTGASTIPGGATGTVWDPIFVYPQDVATFIYPADPANFILSRLEQ